MPLANLVWDRPINCHQCHGTSGHQSHCSLATKKVAQESNEASSWMMWLSRLHDLTAVSHWPPHILDRTTRAIVETTVINKCTSGTPILHVEAHVKCTSGTPILHVEASFTSAERGSGTPRDLEPSLSQMSHLILLWFILSLWFSFRNTQEACSFCHSATIRVLQKQHCEIFLSSPEQSFDEEHPHVLENIFWSEEGTTTVIDFVKKRLATIWQSHVVD